MIYTPIKKLKTGDWDASEELVVINNYHDCTSVQIAEYLNRSQDSIEDKIKWLIRKGRLKHKQKATLNKQKARKREILKGE
jgi:hypothetical protein